MQRRRDVLLQVRGKKQIILTERKDLTPLIEVFNYDGWETVYKVLYLSFAPKRMQVTQIQFLSFFQFFFFFWVKNPKT